MISLNHRGPLTSHTPSSATRVRVLIVDDSVVMRRLLAGMLRADPVIEVIGSACDGVDALEKIAQLQPDVVTLDVEMPRLDGLGVLRLIRERYPSIRIIMCSSLTERGAQVTLDALMAGACDYVTKLSGSHPPAEAYDTLKADLIAKVRSVAGITPSPGLLQVRSSISPWSHHEGLRERHKSVTASPRILAIGVSTGGPSALAELWSRIPPDLPVPIVIVQHMPPLFTALLAESLTRLGSIPVVEATDGMLLLPGKAVLAPGNYHMQVVAVDEGVAIRLNQEDRENSCRPAVDVLLRSIADVYGGRAIATILTGMGQDGLSGARQLKQQGAHILAQDRATSVVWGMPGAIVDAGLADAVLPLQQIIPEVLRLL